MVLLEEFADEIADSEKEGQLVLVVLLADEPAVEEGQLLDANGADEDHLQVN